MLLFDCRLVGYVFSVLPSSHVSQNLRVLLISTLSATGTCPLVLPTVSFLFKELVLSSAPQVGHPVWHSWPS